MIDLGTFDKDISVDYPDFAKKLCKQISNNNFGILVCGTGIGMSIMANRYKNVRASLVHNNYTAKFAREHNNANVLTLGARTLNPKKTIKLVDIFFKTKFLKGRHLRRINKFKYV
jgi:ribose 5-phosphate isomerase B